MMMDSREHKLLNIQFGLLTFPSNPSNVPMKAHSIFQFLLKGFSNNAKIIMLKNNFVSK